MFIPDIKTGIGAESILLRYFINAFDNVSSLKQAQESFFPALFFVFFYNFYSSKNKTLEL